MTAWTRLSYAVSARLLAVLVLCSQVPERSLARDPGGLRLPGYQLLDSTSGALLLLKHVPLGADTASAYLQVIDLHRCAVRQLCIETSNKGVDQGKYFAPGNNSPYFRRFLYTALDSILQTGAAGLPDAAAPFFSVTNGQFFEQYQESTQLSFPVKVAGKVLTGGSSPYGPTDHPRSSYYRTAQLRALLLSG
ncbi:MAG TPA: hypothetical protein VF889_05805, partial [Bacteroidota bacterium]